MRNAILSRNNRKPHALSLQDLAAMRDALELQAEREQALRLQVAREKAQRQANTLAAQRAFADALDGVIPLPNTGRIEPERLRAGTRKAPIPAQREQDEAQALAQSLSDQMDVERLLDTDSGLAFRQPCIGQDVLGKLRRGQWVVQAQLDLHGLRVDEARERVVVFLQNCTKRQIRCVRIIHGKGLGSLNKEPVLKSKVQAWLSQRSEVLAWVQAPPNDGGSGAVVLLLSN